MHKEAWNNWATSLKKNVYSLYLAYRDDRVPIIAKICIALIVAYAVSPIDLIPDFIPILGYLDDLVLLPLGIWLAIHLIPQDVWQECQESAAMHSVMLPRSRQGMVIIIIIWFLIILGLMLLAWFFIKYLKKT